MRHDIYENITNNWPVDIFLNKLIPIHNNRQEGL